MALHSSLPIYKVAYDLVVNVTAVTKNMPRDFKAGIGAPKAALKHLKKMRWNESDENIAGALSVYDGLANTRAMAEAGSKLAVAIAELRIGGRDDWYLPSRGEALLAYAADLQGAEVFERDWYWTSTQTAYDPAWAWCQSFNYGLQGDGHKGYQYRVFAVRREPIL